MPVATIADTRAVWNAASSPSRVCRRPWTAAGRRSSGRCSCGRRAHGRAARGARSPTELATGRRLGEIVVERGWVSEPERSRAALARAGRARVSRARGTWRSIRRPRRLLPEKFARRYGALPVRFVGREHRPRRRRRPDRRRSPRDDLRLALGLNVVLAVVARERSRGGDRARLPRRRSRSSRPRRRTEPDDLQLADVARRRVDERPGDPARELRSSRRRSSSGASDIHFEPQERRAGRAGARRRRHARRIADLPKDVQAAVTSASRSWAASTSPSARAAGRPHHDQLRQPADGPPHRRPADDLRRAGRAADPAPRRRPARARRLGMSPRSRRDLHARDQPAVRRRARRRPDRHRQDDDAVRGARPAERRRARADDDRGPGRVPDSRASTRSRCTPGPASPSRAGCARSCAPTPTSCSSASARRGDRPHRDPGGDDGPPRADVAAHAQRRGIDRAAQGHGHRAVAPRDAINCIVAQRLARRLCENCRQPYEPSDDERAVARARRPTSSSTTPAPARAAAAPATAGGSRSTR